MRISELYGPVRQGEGALVGELMPFIRTAGCNLACSWCDSAYTWRGDYKFIDMTPKEVIARVMEIMAQDGRHMRWVSLTGGEPTIQHEAGTLVSLLGDLGLLVIVETNGLRSPAWFDMPHVMVSCSPKLKGSGQDSLPRRDKVRKLTASRRKSPAHMTQYKFVITCQEDLDDVQQYCRETGIGMTHGSPVFLQPDGYVTPVEKYLETLQWLDKNAPEGFRVVPQVHRLVHGPDARGV